MSNPSVFIFCGQFTDVEKRLGKQIVELVKTVTGLEAYFAEEVQDLNGLDSNILGHYANALRSSPSCIPEARSSVLMAQSMSAHPSGSNRKLPLQLTSSA